MVDEPKPSLRDSLLLLTEDAAFYFDAAAGVVPDDETYKESFTYPSRNEADIFWNDLPESLQTQSRELVKRVIAFAAQLAPVLKSSPLNSEADQRVLMIGTKAMRSALRLRRFRYEDMQVLHDEGTVLGVQPASESDNEPLYPKGAEQAFTEWVSRFIEIIQLVEAGDALSKPSNGVIVASQNTSRYRPGTAFIMMWMDPLQPDLDDVRDAVKEVFAVFGIHAIRADDIEHADQITQKVLDAILTAEFLFTDLTGGRPNVYYEIGYAHALGKRPILYRKANTGIHFDLASYNCPEYTNLHDLKAKLSKRLSDMTNKKPQE